MNKITLKTGWIYAFSLFRWSELKLILLASLMTTKRAIKPILPLAISALALSYLSLIPLNLYYSNACKTGSQVCSLPFWFMPALIPFMLSIVVAIYVIPILAIRTSHERKDFYYFWSYRTAKMILFTLILLFPFSLFVLITKPLHTFLIASSLVLTPITTAFWIGSTFFFLDAISGYRFWEATKLAVINGFKMTVYFTPIFMFPWQFTLTAPLLVFSKWLKINAPAIMIWGKNLQATLTPFTKVAITLSMVFVAIVVAPILIALVYSFYAVLYLKLKHNHHDFFFKRPEASQTNEID